LALLWNSAANAQPAQAQTLPQTPTPAPVVNCDSYLPPGFKIPKDAIATRVSYRLSVDRTVHDLAVYRSSGNADLDKAALQCAGTASGWATIQDANPTEINWIGAIYWNVTQHILMDTNPFSELPNICLGHYPTVALRLGVEGDTLVSYCRRWEREECDDNAVIG
jgi:hypothetical protein